jgi:ATP-dependent RNA helicase DDX54/DBP10
LQFIKLVSKEMGLRTILIVGGESMTGQFSDMALNPDIIVATPGRLLHHIIEVGISFKRLEVLVFDEADRMFEMGFADQIAAIGKTLRSDRQTMLFSATLPTMVYEFARAGLNDPKLIRLDKNVTLPPNLELGFFLVSTEQKVAALMYLFKFVIGDNQQTIVFCATRHSAQFVKILFEKLLSIECGVVFGSMDPEMRKRNVDRFRGSNLRVLIVTDVAARGIDIPALQVVVNYDMPPTAKVFVHRVGRVGRGNAQLDAAQRFFAYSIVSTMDISHMCDVHLFLNKPLKNAAAPEDDRSQSGCYYGSLPPMMIDAELNSFRNNLHDVDISTHFKIANNAAKSYMRTRTLPSKEGAAMSKALGHVALHPKILELGEVAGGDAREEERLKLVRNYLGSYRPKETALELPSASDAAREAMAKKRLAHPERHDPALKRAAKMARVEEREDEEEEEVGEAAEGVDDEELIDDEVDADDDSGGGDDDEGGARPTGTSASAGFGGKKRKAPGSTGKVRVGSFGGAYKDPKFFLSYTPDASINRAEIDGLKVKETMGGERDVILDLMGDDDKALTQSARMVWDRRRKKYVGLNEASDKHTSIKSTTSTRQLVNEAGKKLTKKDSDKKRGKLYEDWAKKTKTSIPMAGEQENPDTAERYKSLQRRSKWKATPEPKGEVEEDPRGQRRGGKGKGGGGNVRDESAVKKHLQQQAKNKFKNQPKAAKKGARKGKAGGGGGGGGKGKPGGGKGKGKPRPRK